MSFITEDINSYYGTAYGWSYGAPSDRSSNTYAQDMRAYLARQEWLDYKNRFMPIEDALLNSVNSRDMLNERLSAITINNANARQTAEANLQVQQGRYGVVPTQQQYNAQQQGMDRMQAIANANAMNQTRTHIYDRNMNVMAGGSGAMRGAVREGYGG